MSERDDQGAIRPAGEPAGFALDAPELAALAERVARLAASHLAGLPRQPVFRPYPAGLRAELETAAWSDAGEEAGAILDDVERLVEPYPFGQGHPRFLAYVNPPPDPLAALLQAVAAALNSSCGGGNHAATYVERAVVRWLRELVGMPEGTAGLLVGGGSAATLTALAVARHAGAGRDVRRRGLAQEGEPLVVYAGEDAHSSVRKAVEALGIGSDNLRTVAADERRRLRPDALAATVEADRAAGRRPLAAVASAGTTATGAVDPLAELSALCRRLRLWLHVDAAYGGPALLSERHRDELEPLARADSLALDPHKWLYAPIDAGLVLVRDGAAMRDCFSLVPSYLPRGEETIDPVGGPPWWSEYGFEQTRSFRALGVWAALRRHGRDGYRRLIEHDLALADQLAALVEREPRLELLARGLSVVCFRHRAAPGSDADALNRDLLRRLQLGGRAFLSGVELSGTFALRACILNPRAAAADVEALVAEVLRLGALETGAGQFREPA